MKTLQLNDTTLFALKLAVEMSYDTNGDILFDDIPLSVSEIRALASKSDEDLKAEMKEIRDDFNAKVDHIEALAVLKNQLQSL